MSSRGAADAGAPTSFIEFASSESSFLSCICLYLVFSCSEDSDGVDRRLKEYESDTGLRVAVPVAGSNAMMNDFFVFWCFPSYLYAPSSSPPVMDNTALEPEDCRILAVRTPLGSEGL